jgi:hypothetical protein
VLQQLQATCKAVTACLVKLCRSSQRVAPPPAARAAVAAAALPTTASTILGPGALLQQLLQLLCWRKDKPLKPVKQSDISFALPAAATTAAAVLLP